MYVLLVVHFGRLSVYLPPSLSLSLYIFVALWSCSAVFWVLSTGLLSIESTLCTFVCLPACRRRTCLLTCSALYRHKETHVHAQAHINLSHICLHVQVFARTHVYLLINLYLFEHMCTRTCVHSVYAHVHVHMYVYDCICACREGERECVCLCSYTHVYIDHIYIYTHTYAGLNLCSFVHRQRQYTWREIGSCVLQIICIWLKLLFLRLVLLKHI